jgi:hypothetical protein
VRLVPLLLVLVLAACGSGTEQTGVPASSGRESASGEGTASGPGEPEPAPIDESDLQPPAIFLLSEYGKQKAVRGSYCVDYVDETTGQGSGICTDGPAPFPKSVTSIAPQDRVTFVLEDAVVKRDAQVAIHPLGCTDEETGVLDFEPGTGELDWKVNLPHGAYQLDVFAPFKVDDGRRGDVYATLGLTVAGPKTWDALGVQDVDADMKVCPFPD